MAVKPHYSMLSLETERSLAQLLVKVADLERQVEVSRQVLAEVRGFETYSAFRLLDRYGLGYISVRDIQSFLDRQRIASTEEEVTLIVKQYDSDGDGRLSREEISNLLLPSCSPALRDIVLSRSPLPSLSYDAEYALSRLFEREVLFHREVEAMRRDLGSRYDYSMLSGFQAIDTTGSSYIDRISLRRYINRAGLTVYDEDLDAIFRRCDTDADERLSYTEFVDSLTCRYPVYRSTTYIASPVRNSSPLKASSSLRRTPSPQRLSGSLRRSSPDKFTSSYRSPEKTTSIYDSPTRSLRASGSRPAASPLPALETAELTGALQEQVDLARQLDGAKVDLALRSDFTLTDCFRVFDRLDRGQISPAELEDSLVLVDIRPVRDEVYLLVKRYSSLGDNQLRYSDFIEMLSPRDPEYRRILSNRPTLRGPLGDPRTAFSLETFDRLNRVFRLLLETEMSAERVRQRLSSLPRFNYMDAFQTLDKSGDGYITSDEFQEVLRQSGFRANRSDLQSLMERYDKNKDGRVSYSEFVAEVSPKSPRKY